MINGHYADKQMLYPFPRRNPVKKEISKAPLGFVFAGTAACIYESKKAANPMGMRLSRVFLAEAVRFELTEDSHPRQFSRLLHSTALPSFL